MSDPAGRDAPAGDGQTTMELLVDDLLALLDRLALGPAVHVREAFDRGLRAFLGRL